MSSLTAINRIGDIINGPITSDAGREGKVKQCKLTGAGDGQPCAWSMSRD